MKSHFIIILYYSFILFYFLDIAFFLAHNLHVINYYAYNPPWLVSPQCDYALAKEEFFSERVAMAFPKVSWVGGKKYVRTQRERNALDMFCKLFIIHG